MTDKLGRYEILEEIGQGSFAIVYRARDTRLDRLVALKELRPMLLADPGSVKDFRQEARNIARLDHPNVATIYDVYEDQQRLFIVMQLVDGSSLAEMMATQGHLSWSESVEIFTAVAAGLDYAHARDILHRDLKPANILLDSKYGPMLNDFGLAKLIGEAGMSVTSDGKVVGTSHYIAPEVWEGQGTTRQSDIYALGCILYEMLTGEKMYKGETLPATMMAHFKPLALSKTWPEGVPSGVADVLATALAKKPADRYATAGEMVKALVTLTEDKPKPAESYRVPEIVAFQRTGQDVERSATSPPFAPTRQATPSTPQSASAGPGAGPASIPILTTKLYPPPTRSEFVPRPRLIERLNEGLHRKLTLVSASAGFGKTTLVSNWIYDLQFAIYDLDSDDTGKDQIQNPKSTPALSPGTGASEIQNRVAWLSLDETDNDPTRFWVYVIAAMQTVQANVGETALMALQASGFADANRPSAIEPILILLLNEIATHPDPISLILDDYHLITTQEIHDTLDFLIDHLPPRMHLIIITREDPPLSLSRLRVRQQVTEIRVADLRFTKAEVAVFLNDLLGLNLSPEEVAALEARTEGWIAGLQLASIAMQSPLSPQNQADKSEFVAAFTGNHRYLIDYLVDEVMSRQPEEVQTFLRRTSILARFCAPLCDALIEDALIEGTNSRHILRYLEQANLFLVPLDNERRWYRYHHLFADFLNQLLREIEPDLIPELHRRAGDWFARQGLKQEALPHAMAVEDYQRAAIWLETLAPDMLGRGEHAAVSGWINALPDNFVRERPYLCVYHAWVLAYTGQIETAEDYLLVAEASAAQAAATETAAAETALANLPQEQNRETIDGYIAANRAYLTFLRGDLTQTIAYARQALDQLPSDEIFIRAHTALYLGVAYRWNGDLQGAIDVSTEIITIGQKTDNRYLATLGSWNLAELQIEQAQLHKAMTVYRQALQFMPSRAGQPDVPFTGYGFIGMGRILREWNELEAALRHTTKGVALCREWNLVEAVMLGCIELAHIHHVLGQDGWARETLQEAKRLADEISPWAAGWITAYQARFDLARGDVAAATRWAQAVDLNVTGELSYQREVEYLTLARVRIAENQPEQALPLLTRLHQIDQTAGRIGNVLEILVLQALALSVQGNIEQALTTLKQAITIGQPEKYIRIFVDEGPAMADLLRQANSQGIAPDYINQLLSAFPDDMPIPPVVFPTPLKPPLPLVDPLNEREIAILHLMAAGLSNREIGDELYLSTNTIRWYASQIYSKLSVKRRGAAVARAQELGII